MSLELHWTCDGCGRREIGAPNDFPKGWSIFRGRRITHYCAECAPPKANSGFLRQFHYWCLRNPALAAMAACLIMVLLDFTAMSVFAAWKFRQMHGRIVELEKAQSVLPEQISAPPQP